MAWSGYGEPWVEGAAGSARGAGAAAHGELVGGRRGLLLGLGLGAFGRQRGEGALDRAPDPAQRDAEHALATAQQVDDLVVARALVHRDAVAHQRDLGEVVDPAGPQVVDRGPDLLE